MAIFGRYCIAYQLFMIHLNNLCWSHNHRQIAFLLRSGIFWWTNKISKLWILDSSSSVYQDDVAVYLSKIFCTTFIPFCIFQHIDSLRLPMCPQLNIRVAPQCNHSKKSFFLSHIYRPSLPIGMSQTCFRVLDYQRRLASTATYWNQHGRQTIQFMQNYLKCVAFSYFVLIVNFSVAKIRVLFKVYQPITLSSTPDTGVSD